MDQRFRHSERIRYRRDYARVFALKASASDSALVIYVAPNGRPYSRLGRSVSRRIGTAVKRNYVRRRIREAFRTSKEHLPTGLDIVVVAKAGARQRSCKLAESLCRLVRRAARKIS